LFVFSLTPSLDIRYQVYFRLKHKRHPELLEGLKTNMWADLEGMEEFVREKKLA